MTKNAGRQGAVRRQVSYPLWLRLVAGIPLCILLLFVFGALMRFRCTGQLVFDAETAWFGVGTGVLTLGFCLFYLPKLHKRKRIARTGTREEMQQEFSKPVTRSGRLEAAWNVLGIELGCPIVRSSFRQQPTVLQGLIRKDPSLVMVAAFSQWMEVAPLQPVSGPTVLHPEVRNATERLVKIITSRHPSRWEGASEFARLSAFLLARVTLIANDPALLERARAYLERQPWDLETLAYQAWLEAAAGDVETWAKECNLPISVLERATHLAQRSQFFDIGARLHMCAMRLGGSSTGYR
jgi:hypothetical protein